MADKKPNLFFRLIRYEPGITLGQWLYDRITANWTTIISLVGFAVTYYTASISPWVERVGVLGWWLLAVGIFLLLYLGLSYARKLRANAALQAATASYVRLKEQADSANVLASTFEDQRINILDFYHPDLRPVRNVVFRNCDILGPALVYVLGNWIENVFVKCDAALLHRERMSDNALQFWNCSFYNCRFYRVTFMVSAELYFSYDSDYQNMLPIVSDDRVTTSNAPQLPLQPPEPATETPPKIPPG